MGCKLPTCMAPEELSSVKMFSVDDPLNSNYNKESEKEDYDPPKKKKKNKEKRPAKGLDLKLGQDSDSEKKMDTPSVSDTCSTKKSTYIYKTKLC